MRHSLLLSLSALLLSSACTLQDNLSTSSAINADGDGGEATNEEVPPAEDTGEDSEISLCWQDCVDAAWPNLIACIDAGSSYESCAPIFNAEVYACGAGCYDNAPTPGSGGNNSGSTGEDDPNSVVTVGGWIVGDVNKPGADYGTNASGANELQCNGTTYRRYNETYSLWVAVQECGNGFLRFYLSPTESGEFLPALDYAGHGQDLCELVRADFTLSNEDDITSGGCESCATGSNVPVEGVAAYGRGVFGQEFQFVAETPFWSYQASRINCGIVSDFAVQEGQQ